MPVHVRLTEELIVSLESTTQPPDRLTARETEVLQAVAAGMRNAEIASELVIAPATVTRHISNILAKTGLTNRAELTAYAYQQGLIDESDE